MQEIPSKELLAEKSLLDVYKASRRMSVSYFNQGVSALTAVALAVFCWLSPDDANIAQRVRDIADYGFAFATSILSFLIAGFTIYLTVTKVDFLMLMASKRHKATGLPWVKFISFSFLRIMAAYVAYCLACVLIKLFASPGGMITLLANQLPSPALLKYFGPRIVLVVLGGATVHLVMLLQSFIFNIYNVSMTVLCLDIEDRARKAAQTSQPPQAFQPAQDSQQSQASQPAQPSQPAS